MTPLALTATSVAALVSAVGSATVALTVLLTAIRTRHDLKDAADVTNVKLDGIHVLVNSRLQAALTQIARLEELLDRKTEEVEEAQASSAEATTQAGVRKGADAH